MSSEAVHAGEKPDDYVRRCFAEYGLLTDESGAKMKETNCSMVARVRSRRWRPVITFSSALMLKKICKFVSVHHSSHLPNLRRKSISNA